RAERRDRANRRTTGRAAGLDRRDRRGSGGVQVSRIDQLIAEFAPEGVELKPLGEVLRIKSGKDHKPLGDGDIPVYGSGGIMRYADTAAAVGPSVLIPRKGSLGNLFYVEGPFWVVDTIFRTE